MSSSSQVRLAYIAESTYGSTPTSGDFETIRFNSESLSGTPVTNQSAEVRADRQPTGNNLVGIDLGGDVTGNLSPTTWVTDFMEAAMMDTWNARISSSGTITLAATGSNYKLTRSTGSFTSDGIAVGDLIELATGFGSTVNHKFIEVTTASALNVVGAGPASLATAAGSGDEVVYRHKYCEVGSDDASFSMSKNFQDLATGTALSYRGMRVNSMTVDLQARQDGTVSFNLVGGGTSTPYDTSGDLATGRTVNTAETQGALNGSNDAGLIIVDQTRVGYCVGGFNLQINNNMTPQVCVGQLPASQQNSGEATANVTLNAFLSDDNFSLHANKQAGTTIAIAMPVTTSAGEGYAFSLPAFKPAFPDAQSGGKNQQTILPISGVAEPTSTRNAVRVYHVTQS